MKRTVAKIPLVLLPALLAALLFSGCSSGGATSGAAGGAPSSRAGVELSFAPASAGESALAAAALAPADPDRDDFESPRGRVGRWGCGIAHVYMDVVRISLLPAALDNDCTDLEGELNGGAAARAPEGFEAEAPGVVSIVPAGPTRIDLLALGDGRVMARFLDRFDRIPAGTYDKVRVAYDNVTVVLDDPDEGPVTFRPTARSRFDLHFLEGHELVIPESTDRSQPDGWVRFFRVKVDLVGLKIRLIDKDRGRRERTKVILRPQVFARYVPEIVYAVAGTADRVAVVSLPSSVSGTFDVRYGLATAFPRTVPVAFDNGALWRYSDDVLAGSSRTVDIPNSLVSAAFRDRAKVEVLGTFSAGLLRGTDVTFTFPDAVSGVVDNGWRADNTLFLREWTASFPTDLLPGALLHVLPSPDRWAAYYDDAAWPYAPLTDLAVDNNVLVPKARGYGSPGAFEAFWFSLAL